MPKQICTICGKEVKGLKLHNKWNHPEVKPIEPTPGESDAITKIAIINKVGFLEGVVERLGQQFVKVGELEVRVDALERASKTPQNTPQAPQIAKDNLSAFPVPQEYREVVDTLLNPKFGIKMEAVKDTPEFNFTIVVPDQYSSINAIERQAIGGDLRSRIIPYSEGVNGVRQWVQKVYDSFNPETKAKIKQDLTP